MRVHYFFFDQSKPPFDNLKVRQAFAHLFNREELDRLVAHIGSARDMLSGGGAVGRRLDFLCQELNREANTTCSKSSDLELTRVGLALKTTIEQFREQVQNVE